MPQLSRAGLLNSPSFNNINNTKNLKNMSGKRGSNPRPQPWKGCALPAELLPHFILWGEQDSNLRRHMPADLQSAPVDRFGISP
jgi:hypothetical protein